MRTNNPPSAALLRRLLPRRACLRAAAATADAAAAAVGVDIVALRRPLGSVSAGVCTLDLFGRLVAQKESLVEATQIPGKP